jgi:hypothetical protein
MKPINLSNESVVLTDMGLIHASISRFIICPPKSWSSGYHMAQRLVILKQIWTIPQALESRLLPYRQTV